MHRTPTNDETKKSLFLALPRELRDLIYSSLLQDNNTRTPPADPERGGERIFQSKIYFEARSPRPALLQLKLTCRQIYAEVTEACQRHHQRHVALSCESGSVIYYGSPAILDIMVKGSSIWPTWIELPSTRFLDPTVVVTLRLFETAGCGGEFSTGAYRGLWSLFNLLVFNGPCLIHNRQVGGLPRPLKIGRLRFDIRLCSPSSVDDLFGTYRDVFDRLEKLAFDNVGLGNVETIEACMGVDRRVWRLRQLPTGLTLPVRID